MRLLKSALLVGTFAAAVMASSPASATPLGTATGSGLTAAAIDSLVIEVQGGGRRAGRGGGGGGPRVGGGGGGRRVGGGGGGRRFGGGGGGRNIGAGIAAGLAIGAIGTAIAVDQQRRSAVEYCMTQFPRYDANIQTGWDQRGRAYRCP
jgi:hypothetical protein